VDEITTPIDTTDLSLPAEPEIKGLVPAAIVAKIQLDCTRDEMKVLSEDTE